MEGRFAPVKVGLMFVPFGFLLAWIALQGIIGMLISMVIAYIIGDILTRMAGMIFKLGTKKLDIYKSTINRILIKNALYILPLMIIAFIARILFGWVTMMPFVATACITYMSAATAEMASLGMKGRVVSMAPSLIASGITMVWTIGFSLLF